MADTLDDLIRQGKDLEAHIEQQTAALAQVRDEIAKRMGEEREYYGQGVAVKKWARVHWEIDKKLLLDELPRDALDYLKEVVFTRAKLDQGVKAGYLPPRLYERAMRRVQNGWNVSLKLLTTPGQMPDWEAEGE